MIKKLTAIVVDSSSNQGRLFDLMIQSLIVLSIVAFSIETLPNLNKDLLLFLDRFELTCVIIFTVEYVLRVFLSSRFKYAFTFFGLIDAIAAINYESGGYTDWYLPTIDELNLALLRKVL